MLFISQRNRDEVINLMIKSRKAYQAGNNPNGRKLMQDAIVIMKSMPSFRELTAEAEKILQEKEKEEAEKFANELLDKKESTIIEEKVEEPINETIDKADLKTEEPKATTEEEPIGSVYDPDAKKE